MKGLGSHGEGTLACLSVPAFVAPPPPCGVPGNLSPLPAARHEASPSSRWLCRPRTRGSQAASVSPGARRLPNARLPFFSASLAWRRSRARCGHVVPGPPLPGLATRRSARGSL
ncbi:hypothetical protein MTO96_005814 [Rhipicephalus appendiculatus]